MRFLAVVIALGLIAIGRIASAATTADVEIRVTEALSHQPIRLARVLLIGGRTYAGYTDATGVAAFSGVEEGQYRATVTHAGFARIGSEGFDVTIGRRVLIDVALAKAVGPKVIGRVQTRSVARLDSTTVGPRSPQERLSGGSLAQALGGLSEFEVREGALSLDGHDSRDTEVSVDGVPTSAGGSTLDLRGLNLDLFSSASASTGSQATAGATLALTTLEPTLAFQTSTTLAYGSDERANLRFWARGTAGRIGYVYGHASGGQNGPTDNLAYADASGLDYLHRSGSSARGDFFKTRIPLSAAAAFSGTFLTSRSRSDIVCERFVGPVPCGFGPGNEATRDASIAIGKLLVNGARSDGTLAVVRTASDSGDDLSRRFVNGNSSPAAKTGRFTSDSLFGSLNVRAGLSTTSISAAAGRARFDQQLVGAFSLAGGGSITTLNATLRREQQLNDRLSAYTALSVIAGRHRQAARSQCGSGLAAGHREQFRSQRERPKRRRNAHLPGVPTRPRVARLRLPGARRVRDGSRRHRDPEQRLRRAGGLAAPSRPVVALGRASPPSAARCERHDDPQRRCGPARSRAPRISPRSTASTRPRPAAARA